MNSRGREHARWHLPRRAQRAAALDEQKPALDRLTRTERTILSLIAHGKMSKEVADELAISYRTVENHRPNICAKLGSSGTNALPALALENRSALGGGPHE